MAIRFFGSLWGRFTWKGRETAVPRIGDKVSFHGHEQEEVDGVTWSYQDNGDVEAIVFFKETQGEA